MVMQGICKLSKTGALAAVVLLLVASMQVQAATNYTDVDILNFALNLEVQSINF